MAKMLKNKDIWAMSGKERKDKVEELRNELMHERGTAAMGGALRSPGKVRALRTSIARVLTIENQSIRIESSKKEKKARAERAAAAKDAPKKMVATKSEAKDEKKPAKAAKKGGRR